MSPDLLSLVAGSIEPRLVEVQKLDDAALLDDFRRWLDRQTPSALYSATPEERFKEWMRNSLLPGLRKLGESGQHAWSLLRDPESAYSKERVASIVLTIAVLTGLQTPDVSTLVAIAVLAIRYQQQPKT